MLEHNKTLVLGQDDNSVEVVTRVSHRAKRISIKVSGHRGVELIVPKNVSHKKALHFLYSKEDWIINKSKEIRANIKVSFVEGAQVPVQGNVYTIRHSGNIRGVTHIKDGHIIVSGPVESIARKVKAFLQELAKKEIAARVEIEAHKLGVKYGRITVRDTSSRWGSCSHKKNLNFSWRLIMAPREVLEYVVAHEICHILEMNHSRKFWALVEGIYPNHHHARKWLKDNGVMLHSYG